MQPLAGCFMAFALFCVPSARAASRGEVVLIGTVGNFDGQLVTIQTETGPAIVPRKNIVNPESIAPGAVVRAVLQTTALDQLNHQDEFFDKPPTSPPRKK